MLLEAELEKYTTLHKEIMAGIRPPRFIKCVLINGWGNVLQEAVSCFLVALVARRAVLFDVSPIEGYMPFREYLPAAMMPFDGYNLQKLRGYQELVIPRHNFTCLNYLEDYADVEWITIHLTYDYFAPNVIVNPHHAEQMAQLLPSNYFQIIFNYLFKLRVGILASKV